jgi:tetratricopeptide (TPR) repeat protein
MTTLFNDDSGSRPTRVAAAIRALSTLWLGAAIFGSVAVSDVAAQTTPFSPPVDPNAYPNPNRDAMEISQLLRNGRIDAANAKVESMLAANPKDAQARFLKGLVLSDQGKRDEAIQAFRSLTEDYPELPEPYNNLASLYAAAGQYDRARMALESAIAANPSYAIAWDNLGDLYLRMAGQAYDKVLQLDRTNTATQAKAAAVRSAIANAPAGKLPGR